VFECLNQNPALAGSEGFAPEAAIAGPELELAELRAAVKARRPPRGLIHRVASLTARRAAALLERLRPDKFIGLIGRPLLQT
jgi:hypothetical protein